MGIKWPACEDVRKNRNILNKQRNYNILAQFALHGVNKICTEMLLNCTFTIIIIIPM
jgi:hypothetical protein